MRYKTVEDITFTTIEGNNVVIKGKREIPDYKIMATVNIIEGEKLDAIITRDNLYGPGNEDLSYLLFEANQKELLEVDFNLSKLKSLKVPILE